MGHVIFGASEYIKDGLVPLNELMGDSPWQNRMIEMLDQLTHILRILVLWKSILIAPLDR